MKNLNETIDMMLSDDYKERFKAEYYQAKIRLLKLNKTLNDYYNENLSFNLKCPIHLLEIQRSILANYVSILIDRAYHEGIDIE